MSFKKLIIDFIPPIILRWLLSSNKEGWFGDYQSWEDAKNETSGYGADIILEKVKSSLLKVNNGEAAFERDSVVFEEIEYSWPVLATIMWIAATNNGSINVIDFGGSLGSAYFQNLKFLKTIKNVSWNIVEQENFVKAGRENFENDQLKFYCDIEECLKAVPEIDLILFSSVIQYIEKPYELVKEVVSHKFPYIIIDRTGFINWPSDRLTIQKVPENIYNASYPCWFFVKEKLFSAFEGYQVIEEFPSLDKANIPSEFRGAVFERNEIGRT